MAVMPAAAQGASSTDDDNHRWEFFLPFHLVSLEIPKYDIKADVVDMAKSATMYFTAGLKWTADNGLWVEYQGWYGKYAVEEGKGARDSTSGRQQIDLGIVQYDISYNAGLAVQADLDIEMSQSIQALRLGYPFYQHRGFIVEGTTGLRYYHQRIKIRGQLDVVANGGATIDITRPPILGGNETISGVIDFNESFSGSIVETQQWAELTLGGQLGYRHGRHSYRLSYSFGSEKSSRGEINYRYDVKKFYAALGLRRDILYPDDVKVVQSGPLMTLGYKF
ncbi:hypothetical protein [Sinobacterium norvegicum]|uniref:hypothetical protein n=1 Tax=Sinobacterium norvegicum TaxID=1641715 RepID=UPI001F1D110F|nr:hypothetical protein [Sinobacterium norvegicum]